MRNILLIACAGIVGAATVKVTRSPDVVEVTMDGKPLTAFHYGARWHKPFVYPLQTPGGVLLSRGWPVEERPGDSKDHLWQRGLYFGHGDINGVDFWRELGPEKTGKFVVKSEPTWHGNVLASDADMITPQGKKLGSVRQEYRFDRSGESYLIDARMSFRADGGVDLTLGDTEEAAFAVRLSEEFREDRGATLMNSDGLTGTKQIWGKRAKWVDYSTSVNGRKVGLAIFDHPSNPGAPTYWHARGYALNSANPFGVRDFTGDKTKNGSMSVPAGKALTFRYLVVMHDGDAAEAGVPKLYEAFAAKP
ncbi:MAG TPA: PmoA family protein [Bryobacteraceae bacterium]|nr:PmoA family protein [Bryobacteraceae bacterium]